MKVVAEAWKSNYIKKVYVTTDTTIFNRLTTKKAIYTKHPQICFRATILKRKIFLDHVSTDSSM